MRLSQAAASPPVGQRCCGESGLCAVWFVSDGGHAETEVSEGKLILPRASGRHCDLDPPYADPHQRAEFQQPEPDGAAGGIGELRVGQSDAAQRAEQHIGHRGEPQAKLVGPHGGSRSAVGEQIELTLLDPVLHLATCAVDLLIEASPVGPVAEVVEIWGGVISGLLQRARLGGETPVEITPWRRIAASL